VKARERAARLTTCLDPVAWSMCRPGEGAMQQVGTTPLNSRGGQLSPRPARQEKPRAAIRHSSGFASGHRLVRKLHGRCHIGLDAISAWTCG
jgi:hypothetical protein